PSFIEQGYGRDWGFVLAAKNKVSAAEIDGLTLETPRQALMDAQHARKLFIFPEKLLRLRDEGAPAKEGSDILLHYIFNDDELDTTGSAAWDTLETDLTVFKLPDADYGQHVLP